MSGRSRWAMSMALLVTLAGCAPTSETADEPASAESSATRPASASPNERATGFPVAGFGDIRADPVSEEVAAEYRATLNDMAGGGGMTATVMSPDGTWSGAAGKADGVRDVRVDDQFAIASITKSVVAAQVMQMVEAGEVALDEPVANHLPPHLDFDTNRATIEHLLGMRSGIPDYEPVLRESLSTQRQRVWQPAELLKLTSDDRNPAGDRFEYTNTNYLLLGLVIEDVRRRPVAEVLRDGVLSGDGLERLVYQPDEMPTPPMAMPDGKSKTALEKGGGYLPSLASATSGGGAAAMASDSSSLARWWRAFCAGEIVSQASLDEMTTLNEGYGLGLYNVAGPVEQAVGHTGEDVGFAAWAGCLPEHAAVIVVLSNRVVEDIGGMAQPLVAAVVSD